MNLTSVLDAVCHIPEASPSPPCFIATTTPCYCSSGSQKKQEPWHRYAEEPRQGKRSVLVWRPPLTACSKEFIQRRFWPFSSCLFRGLENSCVVWRESITHEELSRRRYYCCCFWWPTKQRRALLLDLCCEVTRRASPSSCRRRETQRGSEIGRVEKPIITASAPPSVATFNSTLLFPSHASPSRRFSAHPPPTNKQPGPQAHRGARPPHLGRELLPVGAPHVDRYLRHDDE